MNTSASDDNLKVTPTKQKLLEIANELFKTKGFEAVSVDEICAAAGVTKGSFYHHFDSKNDIPVQQYRLIENIFFRDFNATSRRDAEWRLKYSILWYATFATSEKLNIFKNYFKVMINSPKNRVMRKIEMESKVFTEVIRVGQAQKIFRKDLAPEVFSEVISRCLLSILLDWSIFDGNLDLNNELSKLSEYAMATLKITA